MREGERHRKYQTESVSERETGGDRGVQRERETEKRVGAGRRED